MGVPGDRSPPTATSGVGGEDYESRSKRLPTLERSMRKLWKGAKFLWVRIHWEMIRLRNILKGNHCRMIDADKLLWAPPDRIDFSALAEFDINGFKGSVIPGG